MEYIAVEEIVEFLEQGDLYAELVRALLNVVEQRPVLVAYRDELGVGMMQQHLDHSAAAGAAEYADLKFFRHSLNLLFRENVVYKCDSVSFDIIPHFTAHCNSGGEFLPTI